jgi:phage-related minor tail protein
MATNRIDAGLRILADTAQALRELRALRAEQKAIRDEAQGGAGPTGGGGAAATRQQTQALREQATAQAAVGAQAKASAREAAQAQRDAAREADALRKQEAAAQRKAERDAAAARAAANKAERQAAKEASDARKAEAKNARQEQVKVAQAIPQVTDIVTGLAGGQSPFLVAIQQGGQLRDIFGGLGNAGRALLGIFTPMRVAVGGVAAVLAALALAAKSGYDEQQQFNRSLAATGNIAATSAGGVAILAQQIAKQQEVAVGGVRATLAALATSGQFSGAALSSAGRAATVFARITNQSADDVVKDFTEMKNGVADWAAKTNSTYNFLTLAQYRQIKAAEESGNKNEAMRLTMEALAGTMEKRLAPNLGTIERLFNLAAIAGSTFWQSMKDIGRDKSVEEQLERSRKKVEELRRALSTNLNLGSGRKRLERDLAAEEQIFDRLKALADQDTKDREEAAAVAQEVQDGIKKDRQGYAEDLAAVDAAAAAKLLAQQQAALDKEAALTSRRHEAGLSSELAYNLAMNGIEQRRLEAQAANLRRQIELAGKSTDGSSKGRAARDARVLQLEGQLAGVSGQIAAQAIKAREIVEADALATARARAAQWAEIWREAATEIGRLKAENAAQGLSGIADPDARATATAAAQVAELSARLDGLRQKLNLQLSLTLDPEQAAAIKQQLEALGTEGAKAVEGATRRARFDSLTQSFNEQLQALDLLMQAIDLEGLSVEQAERKKFEARERALPQLRETLALLKQQAATAGDANAVQAAANQLGSLSKEVDKLKPLKDAAGAGFAQLFTDIATGAKTAKEAVRDFVSNFARYMLELIAKKLGEKLVNDLLDALSKMGGSGGGGEGDWIQYASQIISSFFHSGGVVGGGVSAMSRAVSPAIFGMATRYHTGGIAGLKPDEVPAVLRKGEEVLTADDPRHRNNGGGAGINNLNISISVSGAEGAAAEQQNSAARLKGMVLSAVQEWAAQEMRPNGILAAKR